MDGGFQEFNLRGGVENIPGAVGFATAVELVTPEETARLQAMRDRLTARCCRSRIARERPSRRCACRTTPTSRSALSRASRSCCTWTCAASP